MIFYKIGVYTMNIYISDYDAEIKDMVSQGLGYSSIYTRLRGIYGEDLNISSATVRNRVRMFRNELNLSLPKLEYELDRTPNGFMRLDTTIDGIKYVCGINHLSGSFLDSVFYKYADTTGAKELIPHNNVDNRFYSACNMWYGIERQQYLNNILE